MKEIISRKLAIHNNLKRYYTGKPCKNGHICERTISDGVCIMCRRIYNKKYKTKYRINNKDKIKKYYYENYSSIRKREKLYKSKNRGKYNSYANNYRCRKIKATPSWADLDKIKEIYEECEKVSKETNTKHHVDHIIPLQGKNVCGLHVENNLQIITAEENLSKGNKLEDSVPTFP